MFTRVQKKKMLNRTKLHLSVTKANTSFIIYNFMGKFNKKKKSLPLYCYPKGKTDVFLTRL